MRKAVLSKQETAWSGEFARPSLNPSLGLHSSMTQLLTVRLATAAGREMQPPQQTDSSICKALILQKHFQDNIWNPFSPDFTWRWVTQDASYMLDFRLLNSECSYWEKNYRVGKTKTLKRLWIILIFMGTRGRHSQLNQFTSFCFRK